MSDAARLAETGTPNELNARGTGKPDIDPLAVYAGLGKIRWQPPTWAADAASFSANAIPPDLVERLVAAKPYLTARKVHERAQAALVAENSVDPALEIGAAANMGSPPTPGGALDRALTAGKARRVAAIKLAPVFGCPLAGLDACVDAAIVQLSGNLLAEVTLIDTDLHSRRTELVARMRARYQHRPDQESLAFAAAAFLATRGGVPFGFEHQETQPDTRFGGPSIGRNVVVRKGGRLPNRPIWFLKGVPDAALSRFLGADPAMEDMRKAIIQCHPICLLLPKLFEPDQLRDLLYQSIGEDAVSVGKRLQHVVLSRLEAASEKLRVDLEGLTTDSAVFSARAPLLELAAAQILTRTARPEFDAALQAAAASLRPPMSTFDMVSLFGGLALVAIAVGTGNIALGAWLVFGLAAADAALSFADVGVALDDLQTAQRLAQAEDADGLFETLDPHLNSVENAPSTKMAWGFAMLGMLSLVPVAGDVFTLARRLGRRVAEKGRQIALKNGVGTTEYLADNPDSGRLGFAEGAGGELSVTGTPSGASATAANSASGPFRVEPAALVARVKATAGPGISELSDDAIRAVLNGFAENAPTSFDDYARVADFLEATRDQVHKGRAAQSLSNEIAVPLHRAALSAAYGDDFAARVALLEAEDTFLALPATFLTDPRPATELVSAFNNSYRLGEGLVQAAGDVDALAANVRLRAAASDALSKGRLRDARDAHFTFRKDWEVLNLPRLHRINFAIELIEVIDESSPLLGSFVYKITFQRADFDYDAIRGWVDQILERYQLGNGFIADSFVMGALPKVRMQSEMSETARKSEAFRGALYDSAVDGDQSELLYQKAKLEMDETASLAHGGEAIDSAQMAIESLLNNLLSKADAPAVRWARSNESTPVFLSQYVVIFE